MACLSRLSPYFARVAADPALHRIRILVVTPSRVSHSLFAVDPQGMSFRPTIGDLVRRGVMRGTGIDRKWRMGLYFYSTLVSDVTLSNVTLTDSGWQSVKQYETGLRLQRKYTSIVISSQLSRRSSGNRTLETLHQSHVLPDIESSSLSISRSLLPVMRQLKWSIQRDKLAQLVREGLSGAVGRKNTDGAQGSIAAWFESRGRGIVQDGERVRLALCPSVRKMVHFYEQLGR